MPRLALLLLAGCLCSCGAIDSLRGSLRSCSSDAACPNGETCRFGSGCPGVGLCSSSPCSSERIPYCLCNGMGTVASANCPPAPFQARGAPGPFETVYCAKPK